MYLYKIERHPITFCFVISKFEVVNRTPQHYDIQRRGAKNPLAEQNTSRIKKDDPLYLSSPQGAKNAYIEAEKLTIKGAELAIAFSEKMIEQIKEDLPLW